jgi:hypothetical protein
LPLVKVCQNCAGSCVSPSWVNCTW